MSRALTRLGSKPVVVLLSLLALLLVLLASRATWVSGSVDGVAGPVAAQAPGTEAVTGLAALGLLGPAAAVAAITVGRVARWVALTVMALGAVAVVVVPVRVVLQPELVLGQVAARQSGGTGAFEATAQASAWPWLAVAAGLVQLLALGGGLLGARRWGGLGRRYEPPPAGAGTPDEAPPPDPAAGARGERVDSDWDRLSRGDDPTGDDIRDDGRDDARDDARDEAPAPRTADGRRDADE